MGLLRMADRNEDFTSMLSKDAIKGFHVLVARNRLRGMLACWQLQPNIDGQTNMVELTATVKLTTP